MRIFLVCLLAVGALAGNTRTESAGNKQEKRGAVAEQYSVNTHDAQHPPTNAGAYDHQNFEYQQIYSGAESGISGYTSGLQYATSHLPVDQQIYTSGAYDSQGHPGAIYRVESQVKNEAYASQGHQDAIYRVEPQVKNQAYDSQGHQDAIYRVEPQVKNQAYDSQGHQDAIYRVEPQVKNEAYDSQGHQDAIYRVEPQVKNEAYVSQGHQDAIYRVEPQVKSEAYEYNVASQPIQTRVISRLIKVPVAVPHPVPITRDVQIPVPHPVPVEVRRPVKISVPSPIPVYVDKPYPIHVYRPVPVSVPQPIELPHPIPVQTGVSHPTPVQISHQEPAHIGSGFEQHNVGRQILVDGASYGQQQLASPAAIYVNSLGNLDQHQRFNVETRHYNLGGSALENSYQKAQSTVHQQHAKTSYAPSTGSENKDSGYRYNVPTKKFTF